MSEEEITQLRKEFEFYKSEMQRMLSHVGREIEKLEERVSEIEEQAKKRNR
jgi:hypothetical protein